MHVNCPLLHRKALLLFLVCVFIIQTCLVYFDKEGRKTPPFSEAATRGQDIWLANNCQSCHQIYGFGGFLGPDLTNAAKTLTRSRLDVILTIGSTQMPAFHFTKAQIDSLAAYFQELDQTGFSLPNTADFEDKVKSENAGEFFDTVITEISKEHSLTESEQSGRKFVRDGQCIVCHFPYRKSLFNAPDLSLLVKRLDKASIVKTVREGRLERGMIQFTLSDETAIDLIAYLTWLHENHDEITNHFVNVVNSKADSEFQRLWFEYK